MSLACSNTNVTALNQNTYNLLEQFCLCPQAKTLLDTSASFAPLTFETGNYPNPRSYFNGDAETYVLSDIRIEIPKESATKRIFQVLSHVAFELFNVRSSGALTKLSKITSFGGVDMEEYAQKIEQVEYESLNGRNKLFSQCIKSWGIENEPALKSSSFNTKSFDQYFLEAGASCHTDSIRKRWIDNFQKEYCKKNRKDSLSCKVKKSELCDYATFRRMSPEQRMAFEEERICKVYASLNDDMKKKLLPIAREHDCVRHTDEL